MTAKTMTPEDLFAMEFVQSATFSPDGKHVLYDVAHVDTDVDKEFSTLWLHELESGKSKRLTTGKVMDGSGCFSAESSRIAFLSQRTDKPQLFTMPVDGGESEQLTDLKQGVGSGPVWSPDGGKIAFTAPPTFEGDEPIDLTKDVYRVTRNVYRFDAKGYLDQTVQAVYVVDVADGTVMQLTHDDNDYSGLRWSPDGTQLLALSLMRPDTFSAIRAHITLIDLDGNLTSLTADETSVGVAEWSSDGNKVIYVGGPTGQLIGSKNDLWVLDIATGERENRTPSLKVGVGGGLSLWMPSRVMGNAFVGISAENQAYVRVQEGGNLHVYRVALSGDEQWEPVITGDRSCTILDINNQKLLLAVTDMNTPPNLYTAQIDGSNETQLTELNADFLAERAWPKTDHLLFEGKDGVEVEGWYMHPTVGEAPYPTILYIHGGPHAAYGRGFGFNFQVLAGQGYGVLFINHRASTGYGNDFSTAIKGDWGNLDYTDLMAGVDRAIELGLADADKLGCCGTSGGGNLSTWIVGQTDRFKAAVPQNPVTNWQSFYGVSDIGVWFSVEQLGGHPHEIPEIYAVCSPITYAHRCTTPTLLVQSEHDWRCPAEQSEQFYTVLKANGCTAEMLRQPGGSHGASIRGAINLRREHLLAQIDWFDRYVK